MPDAHKNLAVTTVATAPSPATSGVSLVVAAAEGTRFPATPFNATIWPAGALPTPANAEVVRVTARSTDTLTIARAQEGTSARTVVVGDQIAATITVKSLTDVERATFPYNVTSEPYFADPTGAATCGAILNTALLACEAAGGGVVSVPLGDFDVTDVEVFVPDTVMLLALFRSGTRLFVTSDRGAGTYAISTEAVGSNTSRYPAIVGFEIDGPGNESSALGTAPCAMHGVRLNSNGVLKECDVHGFNRGASFVGNHQRIIETRLHHNYDGIYWDTAGSFADTDVLSTDVIENKRAGYAIHGDSFIDGSEFLGCHNGFQPYGIYKENSGGYSQPIMTTCKLSVNFESLGNGIIFDQGGTKGITHSTFENCGFVGQNATWKIAANAADYSVICGAFDNNVIVGRSALDAGYTVGIFNVTNMSHNVHRTASELIAGIVSSGKKFCADANTLYGFYLHGNRGQRYRLMKYNGGGAGSSVVSAVLYHGAFIAGIQGCSKQSSDIPVGVAGWAVADNAWVAVCFEGQIDTLCSTGGGNGAYFAIGDLTTRGKVTLSVLDHVGPQVGYAESGTGGGTSTVFLQMSGGSGGPVSIFFPWKFEVLLATVAPLAAVNYANGSSGVGATLTATSNGTLAIDGVTVNVGERVLVKDQASALQNGIYLCTAAGSGAAPFVLTRVIDANGTLSMRDGTLVAVAGGASNGKSTWRMASDNYLTIGTTAVRWTRASPSYSSPESSKPDNRDLSPTNSILENMSRAGSGLTAQALLASGTVRVFPLGVLRANQQATAINFYNAATASGAPTNSWAGIAQLSDRVIKAISATSTANPAADTVKTFTFAAPFTPDADIMLVGFVMFQVATPPTLYGINQANAVILSAPIVAGTSNTGTTTPLANGATMTAYTADTEIPYAWLT